MPRRSRPTLGRVPFFSWVAYVLGAVALLAHQVTLKLNQIIPYWLAVDWPDLGKHALLIGGFALFYRLSLRDATRPGLMGVLSAPGGWARTALICGGWAALCELSQFRHPYRDFSIIELALNAAMPAAVAGVLELLNPRRYQR